MSTNDEEHTGGTFSSLSFIFMPSTVTSIGANAFYATQLKGATFTGPIASIGQGAFAGAVFDSATQITLTFP
eukprot:gene35091-47155_t